MRTVSTVRLVVAIALGSSLGACEGLDKEVLWTVPSPSGEAAVFLYRQDTGGALGTFEYELVIQEMHGNLPGVGSIVWRSSGCYPSYVFWRAARELEILLDSANSRCSSAEVVPWRDFVVTSTAIRGWSKKELLTSP